MKKVLTVGVFDYFHYGHYRLFKRAKKYGDYLIVAIQNGDYILKYKPNAKVLYSTSQRIEIVKELRCVDEVQTYCNIDQDIKYIEFDVFIVGGDQNHSGFQNAIKWCEENGKEVIRLERTKGISSSEIKENL